MLTRKKQELSNLEACLQSVFAKREPSKELPDDMLSLLRQLDGQERRERFAY